MPKDINLNKKYKSILNKFIIVNKKQIFSFLNGDLIDYSERSFNFFEFNNGFYVIVKPKALPENKKSTITFCLGFPFPVCKIKKEFRTKHIKDFTFHFRGESFRIEQRKILKNWVKNNFKKSVWTEFDDKALFRTRFDQKIKLFFNKYLLYVDPYSFIGDSFIGAHFSDFLIKKYKFSQRIIFSKSFNHISLLGEAYPYDLDLIKDFFIKYKCLILPDLLDINFEKTLFFLLNLSSVNGIIIIPGRSLYVVINDKKLQCFHLNQPDVILKNQNIEDYMNECMNPFIGSHNALQQKKVKNNSNLIFINPFGSLENKTINLDFIVLLCKNLNKNKKLKINLICGLRDCSFHSDWVKKFIELKKENKIKCNLSNYSSLNQLTLNLSKLRPGAILTADTSISHLTHRLNIPTVIFFHAARFDNSSVQSMVSESPLGFGRYFKNSFPLLIREYNNLSTKTISTLLLYLAKNSKNKKQKDFLKSRLCDLFPENYFYDYVSKVYQKKIKKILKKISPINKI
ncbi:MAG TPA: hypothetical protein PLE28_03260 [bacterium]|nr:hypothetical protein [bacterium]